MHVQRREQLREDIFTVKLVESLKNWLKRIDEAWHLPRKNGVRMSRLKRRTVTA